MSLQLFHPKYQVDECLSEIRGVLESGWTGTGPKCAEFEKQFSHYLGDKTFPVYLNSATAALHIALKLCDLPPQSRIATTPITFVSTNAVILYENLIPHFCDIDPFTMSLDWMKVIQAINQHDIKAVLWVHYGGSVDLDFDVFMRARNEHFPHVYVIEDCAHAAGASYADGSMVGSRTDTISCFSFQAVKNLPTFDSGMICLPTPELQARARRLSWLGIDKTTYDRSTSNGAAVGTYSWKYTVKEIGWKYNGNDVAAAIALVQLKCLDDDNRHRKSIHDYYLSQLIGVEGLEEVVHEEGSSHHIFAVRVKGGKRDELIAALKEVGIAPGVHYLPNFEFPVFSPYYWKGDCVEAEAAGLELLSLPNHLRMSAQEVDQVVSVVKRVLG